jgi:hypothetical protein
MPDCGAARHGLNQIEQWRRAEILNPNEIQNPSAAAPQPKGTTEDAEIRVICVICGLLCCPQITQKT